MNAQTTELKRHEAEMLSALGFVDKSFDYPEEVIEYTTAQIRGHYDRMSKSVSLTPSSSLDGDVVRHELIHALQDQHFDIATLLDPELPQDTFLAHLAVVEGDAIVHGSSGFDCKKQLQDDVVSELELFRAYDDGFPTPFRLLLTFPYLIGPSYVCGRLEHGAEDVFMETLPETTQKMMFGAEPTPFKSKLQKREIYRDSVGAFGLVALLSSVGSVREAWELAGDLTGDEITFGPGCDKAKDRHPIEWRLYFGSLSSSQEARALLSKHFSKRFPAGKVQIVSKGKSDLLVTITPPEC